MKKNARSHESICVFFGISTAFDKAEKTDKKRGKDSDKGGNKKHRDDGHKRNSAKGDVRYSCAYFKKRSRILVVEFVH